MTGRPTIIEISQEAILHNLKDIQKRCSSSKVMGVVKANGYGHGIVSVGKILAEAGIDYFGVAFIEEAISLREAGITTPILVFGGIATDQIELFLRYDVEITGSSVDKLVAVNDAAKNARTKAKVHLKIDTGMERVGIHYFNCKKLFDAAAQCDSIEIKGVYSHLATAEDSDRSFALEQIKRFKECKEIYQEYKQLPQAMFHLLNSGGILNFPDDSFDMVRPGLLLYGIVPHPIKNSEFKPALTLKSEAIYFKVVGKDVSVSYGRSWKAPEDTRIITVPIGYGDGYSRRLSNIGNVLIRGKRYPIVGKICMDQFMVNIGKDEVFNGDEVVLIGKQGNEEITVGEIARQIDSVEHEVLTGLNIRIPRRCGFRRGGLRRGGL